MRFCGQCGARLNGLAGTGPALAPAPSTCSPEQLGVMMGPDLLERFRRAGLEASGQRRVVTVLFTDLAGYTELSQQLDPEELYNLIQRLIRALASDVFRYAGAVDKFTGDGLMALFGAPFAQENSAEMAVRAALDMQAGVARFSAEAPPWLRPRLGLHVGIHQGSVIAGSIGSDLLMNYTAIGDTVNLARRLQEASPTGGVLVSEAVFQPTCAKFVFEAVPPLALKGIGRPVAAYRALAARSAAAPGAWAQAAGA